MTLESWLLPAIPLVSLTTGLVIFGLRESSHGLRTAFNLAGALIISCCSSCSCPLAADPVVVLLLLVL